MFSVVSCFAQMSARVPPATAVWIYDTFETNFGIDNNVYNYLNMDCWQCPDKHFPIEYHLKHTFACNIVSGFYAIESV